MVTCHWPAAVERLCFSFTIISIINRLLNYQTLWHTFGLDLAVNCKTFRSKDVAQQVSTLFVVKQEYFNISIASCYGLNAFNGKYVRKWKLVIVIRLGLRLSSSFFVLSEFLVSRAKFQINILHYTQHNTVFLKCRTVMQRGQWATGARCYFFKMSSFQSLSTHMEIFLLFFLSTHTMLSSTLWLRPGTPEWVPKWTWRLRLKNRTPSLRTSLLRPQARLSSSLAVTAPWPRRPDRSPTPPQLSYCKVRNYQQLSCLVKISFYSSDFQIWFFF